jgi:hypothetical protein
MSDLLRNGGCDDDDAKGRYFSGQRREEYLKKKGRRFRSNENIIATDAERAHRCVVRNGMNGCKIRRV